MLDEIAKMRAGGPTDEELKAAKDNLIGGYGLRLETGSDLAEELIGAEIDGLDNKYVVDYPARLDAVTVKEAATAAAQHLDPRALVIVGKAAEVGPMLKKAGYQQDRGDELPRPGVGRGAQGAAGAALGDGGGAAGGGDGGAAPAASWRCRRSADRRRWARCRRCR